MNNDFQTKNGDAIGDPGTASVNGATGHVTNTMPFSNIPNDMTSLNQNSDGAWSASGTENTWSVPSGGGNLSQNPTIATTNYGTSDNLSYVGQNHDLPEKSPDMLQTVSANLSNGDVFGPVDSISGQIKQTAVLSNESGQNVLTSTDQSPVSPSPETLKVNIPEATVQSYASPSSEMSRDSKIDVVLNSQPTTSEPHEDETLEPPMTVNNNSPTEALELSDDLPSQKTSPLGDERANDLLITSMEDRISNNAESLDALDNFSDDHKPVQSTAPVKRANSTTSGTVAEQKTAPKVKKSQGLALFLLGMVLGAALLFSVYLFLFMDKCQIFNF